MNLKISYYLFAFVFWLLIFEVSAQVPIDVVKNKTSEGTTQTVDIGSTPVFTSPVNGTVSFSVTGDVCKIIYTPKNGFVGLDTFSGNFKLNNQNISKFYYVTVRLARVIATPDLYAYDFVKKGEQLMSVTENDVDEENGFKPNILEITSKNNGLFTISGDRKDILFSPVAGFSGVANITYVVCNAANNVCAQTTASILVPNPKDTFEVFTPKFTPVLLPIPKDFVLLGSSANGSLELSGHFLKYTPKPEFSGKESLLFQNVSTNQQIAINVNVLSRRKNIFAFDDFASLLPGGTIPNWNLLANDNFSGAPSVKIVSGPRFGKISQDGSRVTYEAPKSSTFSGVDEFTYELSQDGLDKEIATAYIRVSRFEPNAPNFNFATPKGVPLKVIHTLPASIISEVRFEVSKNGNGSLTVNSDNTLTYSSTATGEDMWELDYSVRDNSGSWKKVSTIKLNFNVLNQNITDPCFAENCVWSGDTNNDGIVSLADLLPIGQYLGNVNQATGPVETAVWFGKKAADWNENAALKYVNTNSDTYISDADTLAVKNHMGKTHGIISKELPIQKFSVKLRGNSTVKPGQAFNLDVFIGDKSKPVLDLYGFTLALPLNKQIFDLSKSSLTFDSRSWMAYNSPVFTMNLSNKDKGVMEAAYTRTSGKAADGFGKVGTARIIVIDIAGIKPSDGSKEIQVKIGGHATASDVNGNAFSLYVEPFILTIDLSESKDINSPSVPLKPVLSPRFENSNIEIYPNPAFDFVKVKSSSNDPIRMVQLVNSAGQVLFESGNVYLSETEIPVGNRQTGIYLVRILTEQNMITRKIQILQR
jgi:hypothetical protein